MKSVFKRNDVIADEEENLFYFVVSLNCKKLILMGIETRYIRTVCLKRANEEILDNDVKIIGKYDGSELSTFVSRKFPEYRV